MKTFPGKAGFLIALLSVFVMATLTLGGHASAAPAAGFSTDMLVLGIGEDGSVTFSGNDGGKELKFVWTFPKKLKVTRGAKANLDKFRVNRRKGKLKVKTDGKGSFFAKIVLSSDIAGTYVLSNNKASISFSPEDVTVTVGGPPPPPRLRLLRLLLLLPSPSP